MKKRTTQSYKPTLLVALDMGNTTTAYAIFGNKRLIRSGSVKTVDIPKNMLFLRNSGVYKSKIVILSSVVPKKSNILANVVRRKYKEYQFLEVGKKPKIRLPMSYNRRKLGVDRLVNAYGAIQFYKLPVCIIDFGTAITFDYVSKYGKFEGGLIVPGVHTAANALSKEAALIPKLNYIKSAKNLLGHDTKSAFTSGLLNGFGALADGLVLKMKRQLGSKMTVVATGGFAKPISPYTRQIDVVDPLHTLKSLAQIYWNEIEGKE